MTSNKRLLIVDDQQDLREQLGKLLSRSTKRNETVSLVKQMRSRLLGSAPEEKDADEFAEKGGYEVETAGQGQEAFEMVKRALEAGRPYSVMFLDMRMPPGWDGMETAKRIREIDRRIEIVIMTAYADHDQETIAHSVGTPDKLLYIKKPFQSEEIFQLALCLSSKWGAEEDEKLRKGWLESLIRSMSKIKGVKSDKPGEICASVLRSLLTFANSQKGFIVSLNQAEHRWRLEFALGMDPADAEKYISDNSAKLFESRTTQSFGDKYFLPLKREGYSAVAVVYDISTPSDPEWYKLLSLLVMTASEVLSSSSLLDDLHKSERFSAIGSAGARISGDSRALLHEIISKADSLKGSLQESGAAKILAEMRSSAETLLKQMERLSIYGDSSPLSTSRVELMKVLSGMLQEMKREAPQGVKLQLELTGPPELQADCDQGLLKLALSNIISNSVEAALKSSRQALVVKVDVKAEGSSIKLSVEDDGPGVPQEARGRLFEPFAGASGKDSLGLGLPIARQIFQRHGGSLFFDSQRPQGARFTASLPASKVN